MIATFEKTYRKMNNAESVRQFQPRVALWQPWEKRISFLEGATLKELRRCLLTANRATPSGLRTISSCIFARTHECSTFCAKPSETILLKQAGEDLPISGADVKRIQTYLKK